MVKREHISDKNFIYVPSRDIIFHRLSILSNLSPFIAPPGYSALEAEVTFCDEAPPGNDELLRQVREGLEAMHLLTPEDEITASMVLDLHQAYTLTNFGWKEKVDSIMEYMYANDIYPFGRLGAWEYLNINHIIPRSRDLAAKLTQLYG